MSIWDCADEHGNVRITAVAAEAGVQTRTVRKWVDCGLLPCRRLPPSGRLVFKAAEVVEFFATLERRTPIR